MKTTGNRASEDRMKIIAVAVFVVIAAGLFYFEYFYTGTPSAPAPAAEASTAAVSPGNTVAGAAPAGPAAKVVGTSSTALDPTLHMDAMLVSESVVYSGSGRNIFSPNSAPPVEIPKPITTARPNAVATQVQPPAPPPVVPCPPNCPLIDLKFFGIETSSSGAKQAFLLHDDTVYTASAGDIVLRRYRVVSIEAKSIQVEDMQNNNKQTLPLLAN